MISFFRFSGPLQLAALFIMVWLFRLPLFFTDTPLLWEDVKYLTLGEKLTEGFWMYKDVIDNTPPLAALFYRITDLLFGRSIYAFYIISGFLVFFQALLFKWLCNNNDIISDKSDVPALMYIVVSIVCFDFVSLSPALLSLTFVLIALNSVFKHIKSENNEGEIFSTGLYIGLAYLTFAPTAIFFVLSLLSFIFVTRTPLRHYLLYITGFFFPTLFCLTLMYIVDGHTEFIQYFLFQFPAAIGFKDDFDWNVLVFISIPSLLLSLVGIFRALTYRRFIIYQVIIQRIMFLWLLFSFALIVLFFNNITSAFIMLVPFIAFFITHFFQLMGKRKIGEYLLILYLVYSLRSIYSYIDLPYLNKDLINFNQQLAIRNKFNERFNNKKILVTATMPEIYINNRLATAYYNWDLSKAILQNPSYYENLTHIYNHFFSDLPEVIIDQSGVMPAIFDKIPKLKSLYRLESGSIYIKN